MSSFESGFILFRSMPELVELAVLAATGSRSRSRETPAFRYRKKRTNFPPPQAPFVALIRGGKLAQLFKNKGISL